MISRNSYARLKLPLLAAILAVSVTGCAKDYGVQLGVQPAVQPVVVSANATPPAPLPDIPTPVRDCLLRSSEAAQKRASNADGALDVAQKVDKTKISCFRSHMKWYAELQAARGGGTGVAAVKTPEPEKKTAEAKAKKPAATWE